MRKNNPNILIILLVFVASSIFASTKPITSVKPLPISTLEPLSYKMKAESMLVNPEVVKDEMQELETKSNIKALAANQFDFPGLDAELTDIISSEMMPPAMDDFKGFITSQALGNTIDDLTEVREAICQARNVGNFIENLEAGDLASLPLILKSPQIGNYQYEIIFNSAKIYPKYAEMEVFVRMVIPQKEVQNTSGGTASPCQPNTPSADHGKTVLYFGAKDIIFSMETGIIKGSVGLLSDYALQFGNEANPKAALFLQKMKKGKQIAGKDTPTPLDDDFDYKGCFVNFDCDGFKEIGLGGRIFFSREWVIPTDDLGNDRPANAKDLSPTARVRADFQLVAKDFEDMMFSVNLSSPFKVADWPESTFALGNANVDLSSIRNPEGVPADHPNIDPTPPNNGPGLAWEGLYIETLSVLMPHPIRKRTGSTGGGGASTGRIRIEANDMLIDRLGFSGELHASGEVPLIGGAIMGGSDKWRYSLDQIDLVLENSEVTLFAFAGNMNIPIFSKESPIAYSASFDFDLDEYKFMAELSTLERDIPLWNAGSVQITGPGLIVELAPSGEDFQPSATFNALTFTIGTANGDGSSSIGSTIKIPTVTLTDVTIATEAPLVAIGGVQFGGGIDNSKLMKFPIELRAGQIYSPANNPDLLVFDIELGLNLTKQEDAGGIAANGYFQLTGEYKEDIDGVKFWQFKDFEFTGADISIHFPKVVYATGQLCMFKEHEIYGRGFSAGLNAKLLGKDLHLPSSEGKFELAMMGIFGSKDDYRYFMVDAFVSGLNIGIYPPGPAATFFLDGFGGGIFHNMVPSSYKEGSSTNNSDCPNAASASDIIYVPSTKTKLGVQFATSLIAKGGIIKGKITCIVRFDQDMSLQNISFWGAIDIMPPTKFDNAVKNTLGKVEEFADKITAPLGELKQTALTEAQNVQSGIKARIGISLDFEGAFAFHAFAEVKLVVRADFPSATSPGDANSKVLLSGVGSLDLLIDPDEDRFHLYVGGYYPTGGPDNLITVPDFFGGDEMVLEPNSIKINYEGFTVSANFYFVTGNDLPGPPPPPAEVVSFFGLNSGENNRGELTCEGRSPAKGTGLAFGASAFFSLDKEKRSNIKCWGDHDISIFGGFGFDISLIKYDDETECPEREGKQGLSGFRAGGRVYIMMSIERGKVNCIPIPELGLGLMIRFDVPNPAYFQLIILVKVGVELKLNVELGEECGQPCQRDVPIEP